MITVVRPNRVKTMPITVHGGVLDEGVELIGKPYSHAALSQKVCDIMSSNCHLVIDDEGAICEFARTELHALSHSTSGNH